MDIRSQRTKESIKLTFFSILKDKDIKDITVSELCSKCQIHRKTFYTYYKNTVEILEELFDGLLKDINDLYTASLVDAFGDFKIFFEYVNQYILNHLPMYHSLAQTSQYPIFIHQVDEYYTKLINDLYQSDFPLLNAINKYTLYCLLSGIVQLYTHWIKDYEQCPISKISEACIELCNDVFHIGG